MKTLIIVRHAKAEILPQGKTDFERKLTDSGKKDAEKIANHLSELIACPNVFIASTAKRAWSTAKRFAKAFQVNENKIVPEKKIFEAHADTLIELVKELDDKNNSAIIFGHNPGLSQLAYFYTCDSSIELPTCGVAIISFDIIKWQDADYNNGKMIHFLKP
jgi:phosphohistidine phosphatase